MNSLCSDRTEPEYMDLLIPVIIPPFFSSYNNNMHLQMKSIAGKTKHSNYLNFLHLFYFLLPRFLVMTVDQYGILSHGSSGPSGNL